MTKAEIQSAITQFGINNLMYFSLDNEARITFMQRKGETNFKSYIDWTNENVFSIYDDTGDDLVNAELNKTVIVSPFEVIQTIAFKIDPSKIAEITADVNIIEVSNTKTNIDERESPFNSVVTYGV